jgi:hypothetical protein
MSNYAKQSWEEYYTSKTIQRKKLKYYKITNTNSATILRISRQMVVKNFGDSFLDLFYVMPLKLTQIEKILSYNFFLQRFHIFIPSIFGNACIETIYQDVELNLGGFLYSIIKLLKEISRSTFPQSYIVNIVLNIRTSLVCCMETFLRIQHKQLRLNKPVMMQKQLSHDLIEILCQSLCLSERMPHVESLILEKMITTLIDVLVPVENNNTICWY